MKYFKICMFITSLLLNCFEVIKAQEDQPTLQDTVQKTKVFLVRADRQLVLRNEQRQVMTGDVVFRHDSTFMYCDSAYFFEQDVSLEAFSNVRLEQGDTLFVYGDYLFYDGNIELAKIRYNVRMDNIQQDSSVVTLYTDSLDYDRQADIGYYFEGGRIIDAENELESIYGRYSPGTKIAVFQDSVRLTNPKYILYSDTLEYSTETKIANILGPSIIESDSGVIHTSKGWYDTQEDISLLLDRSEVYTGNRILTGDSLEYDRNLGIGKAYGNMRIIDTLQKVILTGHYGYYDEKEDYAFATDSACAIEYSQGDSLYLYGEILELITIDSTSRVLRAITGVRFYRIDIQGICDSLRFTTQDSVLRMFGHYPVLWNENQQLFGDTIIIFMADSTVDYVHVPSAAFVVQEVEPDYYNQLGGNDLKAYFEGKAIEHIDIDGNAESIFLPLEKDGAMIGLNYTQSSYLTIWFAEGKFHKLKTWTKTDGLMTPIPDLTPEQKTLSKFAWYDDLRPVDRYDIFRFYNEGNKSERPTPKREMEKGEKKMENGEQENGEQENGEQENGEQENGEQENGEQENGELRMENGELKPEAEEISEPMKMQELEPEAKEISEPEEVD